MNLHRHAFRLVLMVAICLAMAPWAGARETEPGPPSDATPTPPQALPDERVRLDWDREVEQLRITDLEGRDITDQVRPRRDQEQISLAIPPQQPFVVKSEQIDTLRVTTEERLTLPGGLVIPAATRPEDEEEAVSDWLRLTLTTSPVPASWDDQAQAYHTELSFGLHAADDRLDLITLERPVVVRVGFAGLEALEALPPLRVEAPGLEHEQTVSLRFVPRTSQPMLRVRSTISDVDLELEALPRLELRPAASSMTGLGLARQNVTLVQLEPHGVPRPAEQPTDISLTADGGGRLESSRLRLDQQEFTATFGLHSSGLAPVTITAFAGGLSATTTIEQHFPWGPVLAALGGGALGGIGRRFVKGARRSLTGRRLVEGVIVASVAYVAGVLGVGYLALPMAVVATEAGAFLTGVLSGFIGVNVLETLTQPGRKPAS
jgi:hypothetical protein